MEPANPKPSDGSNIDPTHLSDPTKVNPSSPHEHDPENDPLLEGFVILNITNISNEALPKEELPKKKTGSTLPDFFSVGTTIVAQSFKGLFQNMYYGMYDKITSNRFFLYDTERMSVDQIGICIDKFNKEDHKALFMNPNFSMLEENGDDWNVPASNFNKSLFSRVADKLYENLQINSHEVGALRQKLKDMDKPLLAMLINVGGAHWTVIHFNFKNNTISYVDSMGSVSDEKIINLIQSRLSQAQQWMSELDGNKWQINMPNNNPSALGVKKQYDPWNCGVFAVHLTQLVSEGKTYDEIDQIPLATMQQDILNRRSEMVVTVEKYLNAISSEDFNS
jgi:hypothetical protein